MARPVAIHHPGLGRQVKVPATSAAVLKKSGWQDGPLPENLSEPATDSTQPSAAVALTEPQARRGNKTKEV